MSLAVDGARPQLATPDIRLPARLVGTMADRLLRELEHHADSDGTAAVPLSVLAAAMRTSVRQVRRSAADLMQAGVIEIVRPAQMDGRYAPKVYRLTFTGARPAHDCTHVLSRTGADPVTAAPRPVI